MSPREVRAKPRHVKAHIAYSNTSCRDCREERCSTPYARSPNDARPSVTPPGVASWRGRALVQTVGGPGAKYREIHLTKGERTQHAATPLLPRPRTVDGPTAVLAARLRTRFSTDGLGCLSTSQNSASTWLNGYSTHPLQTGRETPLPRIRSGAASSDSSRHRTGIWPARLPAD